MRTITVELFDDGLRLSNDTLGRAGEKNVVRFIINFDALRNISPGLTTATLLYKPRNNPVLAMPSVEIPEGDLETLVPDWAMSVFGVTQVQLQLTGEGVETRSYIWNMRVERSLINYGDKPTPVEDWLDEVRDIVDGASSTASLVSTAEGETLALMDSAEGALRGLQVYGRTAQDGTPTPDAPVPLVSVGDDGAVDVTVLGHNLLPYPYYDKTNTNHGVTFTVQDDGGVRVDGTATENADFNLVPFTPSDREKWFSLPVGDYWLSGCPAGGSAAGYRLYAGVRMDNATVRARSDIGDGIALSLGGIEYNNVRFYIRIPSGVTVNNLVFRPQLELGSSATAFETGRKQSLTLSTPDGLRGVPVSSGGNYTDAAGQRWVCDEVDLSRGVLVQRVGRIASYAGESVGSLWVSTTGALDTGAEVLYALAAPVETALSADEVAAYKGLASHYPKTLIYTDEGAHMKVAYAADIKSYIDQRLNNLAAAVVSNL